LSLFNFTVNSAGIKRAFRVTMISSLFTVGSLTVCFRVYLSRAYCLISCKLALYQSTTSLTHSHETTGSMTLHYGAKSCTTLFMQ